MTITTSLDQARGRILRLADVQNTVGLSRSQIYVLIGQGAFPPPIKLSERASGWLETEVQLWISERAAVRDADKRARS